MVKLTMMRENCSLLKLYLNKHSTGQVVYMSTLPFINTWEF